MSLIRFERLEVLVTGGAGFIGSHLAATLVKQGAKVRVLDNLTNGVVENLPSEVELILGDVRNEADAQRAVAGVHVVFHQAAQINPVKAVCDPFVDFEVNVLGTLRLLSAAKKSSVSRFVMASTNLYGDAASDMPLTEALSVLAEPRTLLSPYAAAKAAAEAYLKVFNDGFGLQTVRLRYSNVYGPRQTDLAGSGVIPIFVRQALAGEPIYLFGGGNQTRDFVHVSDVVSANLLAALSPTAPGQAFNIASGVETSIRHLAELVRMVGHSSSEIHAAPSRAADFMRAHISIETSKAVLGWSPSIELGTGLDDYVASFQQDARRQSRHSATNMSPQITRTDCGS